MKIVVRPTVRGKKKEEPTDVPEANSLSFRKIEQTNNCLELFDKTFGEANEKSVNWEIALPEKYS